jgi:PAB-dependent poly(A)-specific ribonuclease subunit 2
MLDILTLKIPTDHQYTLMKHHRYICAATTTGAVNLLDIDNLKIVKILSTNTVGICDMDARNNYLVTCGWVNRPQGTPMLATLANVYDLRAGVQLPPISFHAGAAHVQMHPKMSTTCILASQHGQLQVVDLVDSSQVVMRQANISTYISGLVLAPSGEALAISDADGYIHLWGSPSKLQFAEFSNATEFADPPDHVPAIDVDSDMWVDHFLSFLFFLIIL